MRTTYLRWSDYPYPSEVSPPIGNTEPANWPMFFIKRGANNQFIDPFNHIIHWKIKNPIEIDWGNELFIVREHLGSLTPQQIQIAQYWATGDIMAKFSSMIYHFADKHKLGTPTITRLLGYYHAAIHDTCVITWYLKYLWDVARPVQFDRSLPTVVTTPRFPSYPSAHATLAGCTETILSFFFPSESKIMKRTIDQSARSRLNAGVHFQADNDEGLILGRQIGEMVIELFKNQNQ
jgi:membrane-associated phospholipid phosphatase